MDKRWLVDPQVQIPDEAAAIHGITTEEAREYGVLPWVALAEISAALTGAFRAGLPLAIFNAPYDLTVLDRECRRHDLQPFGDVLAETGALIVDPFVLDKAADPYRKGKRTLTAACEHYGVTLGEAHNSDADTLGAMRVAWKIASRHHAIGARTLAELQEFQAAAKAEQSASFQDYLRKQGKDEVVDGSWPIRPFADAAVPA